MILIGQYDSAFVRRVGITLRLYGLPFEHRPWSVFGDADRLMAINPLGSVPVLVLADGTALNDSGAILSVLDGMVPATRRLWPDDAVAARRIAALAAGLAERFVSLYYERAMHDRPSPLAARRERQIAATLAQLEAERQAAGTPWWFGAAISQADITLACVLRHFAESLPDLWEATPRPALAAHSAAAEALPVFQEISQPFVAPA